jgi:hypothetical protein
MPEAGEGTIRADRWRTILFVGISLSIGWGIRGNFGHEWGAALPGALAAMAVALLSQREDWRRRIAYFALFGAIGWYFGGSMAYMILIAFTHSGDSPSVLYGFACLFVVGLLWAAIGGGLTALPAFLSRERLEQFCIPFGTIFLAWWLEAFLENRFIDTIPAFSKHSPLDWFDSNWISALLAILVVLVRAGIRRRIDWAERLILVLSAGWWAGFLLLTVLLHLYMIPGRSGNWSGSLGMTIAFWIFLRRHNLNGVLLASLITGIIGGLGFAGATLLKLIELKSGAATNWHSILEQTYGLFNGIGLAIAFHQFRFSAPNFTDDPPANRRAEAFAVCFVLIALPYFNIGKEVNDWIKAKTIPPILHSISTHAWFDLFFAMGVCTFLLLLREHMRRPLPIVPASWLGKGQLLYLALLWCMVIGNFTKAVVAFAPERLVTEGPITLNALLCTLMVLLWARQTPQRTSEPIPELIADSSVGVVPDYGPSIRRTAALGTAVAVLSILLCWGSVRTLYGNTFAGYAGHHIRFGPHATSNHE